MRSRRESKFSVQETSASEVLVLFEKAQPRFGANESAFSDKLCEFEGRNMKYLLYYKALKGSQYFDKVIFCTVKSDRDYSSCKCSHTKFHLQRQF